ncbi:MAG: NAD(+)--rifampin ADP-ribosyltransferase [Flavobacteriales bacterium]
MEKEQNDNSPDAGTPVQFAQSFYHGTKADLDLGEFITVGFHSNFVQDTALKHIYLTSTLAAAVWGAELAAGTGRERIYVVEATGPIEDDPNLTNTKFPGNPSMSYRSQHPLKVVGEVTRWQGHTAEQVRAMKEGLAKLKEQGLDTIEN